MLCDLIDLIESPTTHACVWRDGELYIEPAAASPTQFVIPRVMAEPCFAWTAGT